MMKHNITSTENLAHFTYIPDLDIGDYVVCKEGEKIIYNFMP